MQRIIVGLLAGVMFIFGMIWGVILADADHWITVPASFIFGLLSVYAPTFLFDRLRDEV